VASCELKQELVDDKVKNFNIKGYSDYRKMIETERLNTIVICTPPATHEKIALDVLATGCDILCEKPLAMSMDQGKRIADAVEKSGRLFQVAFCHRFEEAVQRVKKSLVAGEFGPITSYRNIFCNSSGYRPTRGGNLMDNGSHATDIMRFLIGDPVEVLSAQFRPEKVDDLDKVVDFSALLRGPKGEMVFLEAGGRHAGGRAIFDICGEKTSVIYDYYQPIIKWNADGKWQDISIQGIQGIPGRFIRQAQHFLDCREGKAKCLVDVHEGIKTLELLTRIAKAAGFAGM